MIPGLGLIRRMITLALCGAAFWAGLRIGQADLHAGQADACRAAGGVWDGRRFCAGATE
jgi:hypothetical protein